MLRGTVSNREDAPPAKPLGRKKTPKASDTNRKKDWYESKSNNGRNNSKRHAKWETPNSEGPTGEIDTTFKKRIEEREIRSRAIEVVISGKLFARKPPERGFVQS